MAKHWVKSGMALVISLAAAGAWGCGSSDSSSNLTCGAGTYNSGGVCVPVPWGEDGGGGTGVSCGAGTYLSNGTCVADPVEAGATCGAGTHKVNGQCVADEGGTTPTAGQVGDPCTATTDCTPTPTDSGMDLICATPSLNKRLVGGYCTVLACSATSLCPSGSACVDSGTGLMACFRYCDPDTDVCRDGYVCQPLSDDPLKGICAPKCAIGSDCPAGGVCDLPAGKCTPPLECTPGVPGCTDDTSCLPTTQSPSGGYCFPTCQDATECKTSEVCQPLAPGSTDGLCTPPACVTTADCPAGATCTVQHDKLTICAPPETCTDTCTATTDTCVGGLCLAKCSAGATGDTECQALNAGLLCADSFGACMPACSATGTCDAGNSCFTIDDVCLPTGSFPTSPCIPADTTHTNPWCLPIGPIDQECVATGAGDICVPTCTADAQCEAVSPALTCVESQGLCVNKCAPTTHACDAGYACELGGNTCLPIGAFPTSPCGPGDTCAANFDGAGHNLKCESGTCLIDCATGGDTLCGAIGTALGTDLACEDKSLHACFPPCGAGPDFTCPSVGGSSLSCFDSFGEKVCLPTGAFPGSPCRASDPKCDIDLQGNDAYDMACFESTTSASGVCLLTCTNDTECSDFNSTLACYEAKGACFPKCDTNADCGYPTAGMACLTSEHVCLPTGAFPGSPCKTGNLCDPVGSLTQSCVSGTCVVDCNDGNAATGDGLCHAVNAGLTCMPTNPVTHAGSCVYACVAGMCPAGYSCLEPEGTKTGAQNACLPNGSFPGGACATGSVCGSYGGKAMTCAANACVITCNAEADCTSVGLTCVESAHLCVSPCTSGACADSRYACITSENACLPKGSFPGGPCNATNTCSSYGALPMACTSGTCLVTCDGTTVTDAMCQAVNPALTCDSTFAHACMPACGTGGACLAGYSCAASQNACLPTGSFPGSACRTTDPKCDENLGGNANLDLVCLGTTCAIDCSWAASICTPFGLTCTAVPGTGGSVCI